MPAKYSFFVRCCGICFFFSSCFLTKFFYPFWLLVAQVKDGEGQFFSSPLFLSIYHASYYSFKDGRYSGFNGVAANNAFAINGVMIPAPIASGIPLIAATPAKVLNKEQNLHHRHLPLHLYKIIP